MSTSPFLVAMVAVSLGSLSRAAVPATDVTLQPVITQNLPIYTSLTNYAYSNDSQAVSTTIGGTAVNYDAPLYKPFDAYTAAWWDNLVGELIQGRLPVVLLPTRGAYTLTPTDLTGPGDLNPRRLTQWMDALNRANATGLFKSYCFVDTPAFREIYNRLYSLPSTTPLDWSNSAGWTDVFWLRGVKPWFDTIPSSHWYRINNRPVIQFWGTHPSWGINHHGNISAMLTTLANAFQTAYGVRPYFIMDRNSAFASNQDTTLQTHPDVLGLNGWFGPPSTPNSMVTFNTFISGCTVPGFINPNYFNPSDPNYNSPNLVIPHNKVDASGVNGDTLLAGLDAAVSAGANVTVIEGWNDVREWAGIYRADASPRYDFPSQYINLVRQYSDLRTVTLRLEAEAADAYSDTTTGNTGGAYRRSGNLDVRALATGAGWQVGWTAANEWIEFRKIYFSPGNYKFPLKYATASAGKRVRLLVDGASLGDVTLPATGSADAFDTINLGQKTIGWGTHTLRLVFIDGSVDVDWLFVRKADPVISLRAASNNSYVCAEGGGADVVIANRTAVGNWERFSIDDMNGGSLAHNDPICLQSYDGLLLSAAGGGGAALTADRRRAGGWESFTIIKTSGTGTVANGDTVAIRTQSGRYLSVGVGNVLDATATTIGPAQTFTVTLGTQ